MMDRRQLVIGIAGGVLGGFAAPRRVAAQQALSAVALPKAEGVVRLNDRLSLLTSGGTNVLALSTPDGLVVVDSGAPESSDRLMESLRQLSVSGRVSTLFNTHYHAQNTGANDA